MESRQKNKESKKKPDEEIPDPLDLEDPLYIPGIDV